MNNIFIILAFFSWNLAAKPLYNKLQFETSPYLLQHKSNPVSWYPWGEEALLKAKREKKPIFLSIGYSTCHWCHVMEEESFTNKKIAKLLNEHFIAIKVDREEMPHLDKRYQEVYANYKHRTGGWPLNIFLTPQLEAFYISTYIPLHKESYSLGMQELLKKLLVMYKNKNKLQESISAIYSKKNQRKRAVLELSLTTFSEELKEEVDEIYGGFGNSKKFPQASKLNLMYTLGLLQNDKELLTYTYEMLDAMALHGLYDQVEGGFFRYAVDASWETPHFEKMLYTQAELLPLYAKAYTLTKKELYLNVVEESVAMLEKYYQKGGVYFSASDADSLGEEGAYFTFTKEEAAAASMPFEANFKEQMHISFEQNRSENFATIRAKLQKIRQRKNYPFIDKKINTAWNAMMVEGLYEIASLNKKYGVLAEQRLSALQKLSYKEGLLYHQTLLGREATQKGLLEDYSAFIGALLSAYEYDADEQKLTFALYLFHKAKEQFYRDGVWYLSNDGIDVAADVNDKYYISALSKMLQNLLKLAALKSDRRYHNMARSMVENLQGVLGEKSVDAPALVTAYIIAKRGYILIKSNRKNLSQLKKRLGELTYPYILTKEEQRDVYIACTLQQCFCVEKSLEKLLERVEVFSQEL